MRMQLISRAFGTLVLSMGWLLSIAQSTNTGQSLETEIDFLFNYYEQDGDNAAVTGGRGTEKLDNIAPSIILNIPLDSTKTLVTNFGFDRYSSASTDRIDQNVSSASSSDTRFYLNASYAKENPVKKEVFTYKGGVSTEYDYLSTSFGFGWAKESWDGNREVSISGMVYLDKWTLIYPEELRNGPELLDNDQRQSYNASVQIAQVISRRFQGLLSAEFVLQTGLLSTPFHRVYFNDGIDDLNMKSRDIERLPDRRIKLPLGVRLNYFLGDKIILRGYYRYYSDDFDIRAHTFSLETPIKFATYFTVYPFIRYHEQSAAKYFAPFGQHSMEKEFYTSDYDLASVNTTSLGLGLKYSPLYGLFRFKGPFSRKTKRTTQLKSIDIRFADYTRKGNNSDKNGSLDAFSVSFDLSFVF